MNTNSMMSKNKNIFIKIIFHIFCFLFIFDNYILSQEITSGSWNKELIEIMLDAGKNWNENSTIHDILHKNESQYNNLEENSLDSRLGYKSFLLNKNNTFSVFNFSRFTFKNKFYSYIYARFARQPEDLSGFTGISQEISRFGLRAGELDMAGLGFVNNNFLIQYGRGRASSGAGQNIALVLGNNSSSYDHMTLGFKTDRLKTRYFHGFLENINDVNRYLVGKSIEWTFTDFTLFSLSEFTIYSGFNRPFDIAYLNPVSSHLEIEFNEKANRPKKDSGNAAWQFAFDTMIKNNFRFSSNYVIDELIIDKSQLDSGKVNGLAYSARLAWTPNSKNYIVSYNIFLIHVGSLTFKHEDGYNNFVSRNLPLGWIYGSDGDEIGFGFKLFNKKNIFTELAFKKIRLGGGSVLTNPYIGYTAYSSNKFPSGLINDINSIELTFSFLQKENITFSTFFKYEKYNNTVNNSLNLCIQYKHKHSF
jgi:hypothetical protein